MAVAMESRQNTDVTWKRFREHRRTADRNTLVVHYAPLVETLAARLARRLPRQISQDEICSAAFDGLLQAVENYDPSFNASFETYCQRRVVGAVMDWLRAQDNQSRSIRTFEKRRARVREHFDHQHQRPPSSRELAENLHMSTARYGKLDRMSQAGARIHFSAMESAVNAPDPESGRPWETPDQRTADPSARMTRAMLADFITRGLTRDERLVLLLYYYEGLTMAEIGAVLELSESRVSQIHKDVLHRLRVRFGRQLAEELAG